MGEARRQGASTGLVRYDIQKGFARLVADPAIVVFGAAAAPLVETWCDKESPLGTVGDVMGRKVYRFASEDDLSNQDGPESIADDPRQPGVPPTQQHAMHAIGVVAMSQPLSKQPGDQGPHRAHLCAKLGISEHIYSAWQGHVGWRWLHIFQVG